MSDRISTENIAAIRTLFFGRLAQNNRELIESHNDIAQEIDVQSHYAVLGLLAEVESRVQAMQTILIVFRESSKANRQPLFMSPNSDQGGFMTTAKAQPGNTAASAEPAAAARKAWIPKTPVDVVLEQIGKQEKRVATLQKELDQEKVLLVKLAKAKAALEA